MKRTNFPDRKAKRREQALVRQDNHDKNPYPCTHAGKCRKKRATEETDR